MVAIGTAKDRFSPSFQWSDFSHSPDQINGSDRQHLRLSLSSDLSCRISNGAESLEEIARTTSPRHTVSRILSHRLFRPSLKPIRRPPTCGLSNSIHLPLRGSRAHHSNLDPLSSPALILPVLHYVILQHHRNDPFPISALHVRTALPVLSPRKGLFGLLLQQCGTFYSIFLLKARPRHLLSTPPAPIHS